MKLLEIFRFEFVYQIRRASPWLYGLVLIGSAFLMLIGNYIHDAQEGYLLLNAPSIIAYTTVFCSLVWLLTAAAIAGEAAARDTQTKMDALIYTSPISKYEFLGGRFLAALVLNGLILLAIPFGIWISIYGNGVEPEILGPFNAAAYLTAYAFIALPNAFFATALQFSLATIKRKSILAYVASLILFILSYLLAVILFGPLKQQVLGSLIDPVGVVTVLDDITATWSPLELDSRLLLLEGPLLMNRLFWFFLTLIILFFTARSFRFSRAGSSNHKKATAKHVEAEAFERSPATAVLSRNPAIAVPVVVRKFGFRTHLRQALAICWSSYLSIFKSRGGLVFILLLAVLVVMFVYFKMEHLGVPFYPVTQNVVGFLANSLSNVQNFALLVIPLLIIFYAGELIWREREAGVSEISNAAPVPEWTLFFGKFLGLSLILLTWLLILTFAGVIAQLSLGFYEIQPELYLQIIFGLRFSEYLLFVIVALVIHTIVNQKHLGHLVALIFFASVAFASTFGIEHNLLIFGADPGWSYTEMRGYAGTLEPWFWFKLYWLGWALLLAVAARLFWVRGRESGFKERLKIARRRFTLRTALTVAVLLVATVGLSRHIFYNTNVLNSYHTSAEVLEAKAEYEHRYGRYRGIPQPKLTGTKLLVEIYPEKRELEITGTYQLINHNIVDMDTIHVAPVPQIETEISFDRPYKVVSLDTELAHFIFALEEPLRPGDSLELNFKVHSVAQGFSNSGVDVTIVPSGTFFTNYQFLPAIGYQEYRELDNAGDRKAFGLPSRPAVPPLEDMAGRRKTFWDQFTSLQATMGTSGNETAFAPGEAVRSWKEGDRHYSSFATSAPVVNQYAFFSGNYDVKEELWQDENSEKTVKLQILHHPTHTANLHRMMKGMKASMDYFSREFGPYPYNSLRFIERASTDQGLQSTVINVSYQENFSYFNPEADQRNLDFPFAIVAHEMAHQWWGNQLLTAHVEGSGILSESLAWYTAMGVAEEEFGLEYQQRLISILRQEYETPQAKADVPLIRGNEWFHNYRKGPLALYTLSKYVGREKINSALRNLLEKQDSLPGLPTSLDLYKELQAVTPDSLQYLAHDLFEVNTHWDLKTVEVTAKQKSAGTWEVTLKLKAEKLKVDSEGLETEIGINDWIEIGIFAPGKNGAETGEALYREFHHLTSKTETITVTVFKQPGYAGIDPYYLLNDWKMHDNIKEVKLESGEL